MVVGAISPAGPAFLCKVKRMLLVLSAWAGLGGGGKLR